MPVYAILTGMPRTAYLLPALFAACGHAPLDAPNEDATDVAAVPTIVESLASPARCDLVALERLSSELGDKPLPLTIALAWPSVKTACADALPSELLNYWEGLSSNGGRAPASVDKTTISIDLFEKACADYREVRETLNSTYPFKRGLGLFEACELGRYDVITRAESAAFGTADVTWATHQWLLDQGLERATLRPITRALFALERRLSWVVAPPNEGAWPLAPGAAWLPSALVTITPSSLEFDERSILRLQDGVIDPAEVQDHLILGLFPPLRDEGAALEASAVTQPDGWLPRLALAADTETPFGTLIDVMHTAQRAQFGVFSILVQSPTAFGNVQLSVSPPGLYAKVRAPNRRKSKSGLYRFKPAAGAVLIDAGAGVEKPRTGPDTSATLSIELTPGAYTLAHGSLHKRKPKGGRASDHSMIRDYAKQLKADDPHAHRVVISASRGTPLTEVVAAIVAARGPQCDTVANACVLPDVVVQAQAAHQTGRGTSASEDVETSTTVAPRSVPAIDDKAPHE